jgi:squalene synthase HpnC
MDLLPTLGPDAPLFTTDTIAPPTLAQSLTYCQGLAQSHYENFSVLTSLVPARLRESFGAVYAFCRWSDDLGDETGSTPEARAESERLLSWWRSELSRCFDDSPSVPVRHPVFIALRSIRARHPALQAKPFHDLIDAFVQDQRVTRYQTWDQCIDYCARSANPVGRIVLQLGGYADTPANAERYRLSDCTCTALQLINFWQDVRRDLLERDRIYLPSITTGITEPMLRAWIHQPDEPAARVPYIKAVRALVDRTDQLFREGKHLPDLLDPELAPVVRLFGAGGEAILKAVRNCGCATLWHRPRLGKVQKAALFAHAWLGARLARTRANG